MSEAPEKPALPPAENPEPVPTPPAPGKTPAPAKKKTSIWLLILRWLLIILIIFGAGFLLAIFTQLVPLRQQTDETIQALQTEQRAAAEQLKDLQKKIDDRLPLEEKLQQCQKDANSASTLFLITKVHNDVLAAQLALAKNDPAAARLALSQTADRINQLAGSLPTDQQKVADDLKTRLKLAQGEIGTDNYAAQSDMDVLIKTLLQIEHALAQ